jgi:hypothetical protein
VTLIRWVLAGVLLLAFPPARALAADDSAAADPATGAIRFYQRYLSDLHHGHCRFVPSCSEYAAQAIATHGVVEGSARAADRLMRCNASAAGHYGIAPDGRLEDPVDPSASAATGLRVPRWLLAGAGPPAPPLVDTLDPGRRARLDEAITFAQRLAQRGDCERASTEYQRSASLAGSQAVEAWAFARIGDCCFAATQWEPAERAYLTSGMLATTAGGRAQAVWRAVASRFDAGSFAACERLLADPALTPSPAAADGDDATVPPSHVAALGGLCALARGVWVQAAESFSRAVASSGEEEDRARALRLQAFAVRGPVLPHRSPTLAGVLSAVIPGAGQAYCGRSRDGFRHLVFDVALIWTVVSFARDDRWPAAYLTAGVTLPFYAGNVIGAGSAARQFDRERRLELTRSAIRESDR